jgi:hypothetical protein
MSRAAAKHRRFVAGIVLNVGLSMWALRMPMAGRGWGTHMEQQAHAQKPRTPLGCIRSRRGDVRARSRMSDA